MEPPRISLQGLRVLKLFLDDINKAYFGADLIRELDLPSGTVYPILRRFEESNLLKSYSEEGESSKLGRPLRRFYRMTPVGAAFAEEKLAQLRPRSVLH